MRLEVNTFNDDMLLRIIEGWKHAIFDTSIFNEFESVYMCSITRENVFQQKRIILCLLILFK